MSIDTEIGLSRLPDETRLAAARYLTRTGNADVLEALGLVADPIAARQARAKAMADMSHGYTGARARPDCPVCHKPAPPRRPCRRTKLCRAAVDGDDR